MSTNEQQIANMMVYLLDENVKPAREEALSNLHRLEDYARTILKSPTSHPPSEIEQDFKGLYHAWLYQTVAGLATRLNRHFLESRESAAAIDSVRSMDDSYDAAQTTYKAVSSLFKVQHPDLSGMVEQLFDKPLLDK